SLSTSNNEVLVTGDGSRWTGGQFSTRIGAGVGSQHNRLVVSNGAIVTTRGQIIIGAPSAADNEIMVIGPGSTLSNSQDMTLSPFGTRSRLTVTNQGAVVLGG